MATSLPIVPTPRPKFEFFVAVLTLAVAIYTAIKVIELKESIHNLEGGHIPEKGRDIEPDATI